MNRSRIISASMVCGSLAALALLVVMPVRAANNNAEKSQPAARSELSPQQAAKQLDNRLADELAAKQAEGEVSKKPAAKRIGDETYIRRLSLDLLGVAPDATEVTSFTLDPSTDKRSKAVARYLASSKFGENWGAYWRDVAMYRRTDDRALLSANAMREFLAGEFNKGTGWDAIARAFISATGDIREIGATGVVVAQFGNANDVASEVSRIFMGVQIQCAQCHDHPTDRWKREQFHELAAFFPRIAVRQSPPTDAKRTFTVLSMDREPPFAARLPQVAGRGSTEHYMPDLKHPTEKGTLMQPVFFVTGQKLSSGKTDQERRTALAEWITSEKDPWFAKAFVNRIWAELIGEGFYNPVDDIGPDRQCSAPKTLEFLANQFVVHHYDVKWLFATIAMTDEYQREGRQHRKPDETPFACNCTQRMRGDQLYDTLLAALGLSDPQSGDIGYGPQVLLRSPRAQFNATFGYDPSIRRDDVAGSIPQALMLMNGQNINRAIDGRTAATALGKLLANNKDDESVVVELYLRCLAREPQASEIKYSLAYVHQVNNRSEAFEDILWALINSTEFLHRK